MAYGSRAQKGGDKPLYQVFVERILEESRTMDPQTFKTLRLSQIMYNLFSPTSSVKTSSSSVAAGELGQQIDAALGSSAVQKQCSCLKGGT